MLKFCALEDLVIWATNPTNEHKRLYKRMRKNYAQPVHYGLHRGGKDLQLRANLWKLILTFKNK